jgi:hypothetical protein
VTTVALASSTDRTVHRRPGASKAARRLREIATGLRAELGGREPSTSEAALITQCATLIVQHEAMLVAAARGEPIDQVQALKLSGLVVRALSAFRGGKATGKARLAGPSMLDSIIAAKRGAA